MGACTVLRMRQRVKELPFVGAVAMTSHRRVTLARWLVSSALLRGSDADARAIIIVTGCDSSHFLAQLNMLASVEEHEPAALVSFWDLGLTQEERAELTLRFPRVPVRPFPYDDFPDYFRITVSAGQYAWKPVIVETEAATADSRILIWMDAGNIVDRPLAWIRRFAQADAFYSPNSGAPIHRWTHPETLRVLKAPSHVLGRQSVTGGLAAFDTARPESRQLIADWSACAQDTGCIAPEGSDRSNHRQDQAVLSVLAHMAGLAARGPRGAHVTHVGVRFHRDT